jgi:hypothetical protein
MVCLPQETYQSFFVSQSSPEMTAPFSSGSLTPESGPEIEARFGQKRTLSAKWT